MFLWHEYFVCFKKITYKFNTLLVYDLLNIHIGNFLQKTYGLFFFEKDYLHLFVAIQYSFKNCHTIKNLVLKYKFDYFKSPQNGRQMERI